MFNNLCRSRAMLLDQDNHGHQRTVELPIKKSHRLALAVDIPLQCMGSPLINNHREDRASRPEKANNVVKAGASLPACPCMYSEDLVPIPAPKILLITFVCTGEGFAHGSIWIG